MKKKWIVLIISVLVGASVLIVGYFAYVWLFVFSDHTQLTGTIIVDKTNPYVGESVSLKLTVPQELENIHRLYWYCEPTNSGTIRYREIEYYDMFTNDADEVVYPKYDRTATFTATKAGKCTVHITGFFKQTNPQRITNIVLNIIK